MRTRLSGVVLSNLSTNDRVRCERSESRAEVIEEREGRQTLEEVCIYDLGTPHVTFLILTFQGNSALRDRLAAMTIAWDQILKLSLKHSDHIKPNWTPIPTKSRIGKPKFKGNL